MSVNSKLVESQGRKAKGSKVLSNTMIAWLPHLLCALNLPTFRLAKGFSPFLFYLLRIEFLDLISCI